MKELDGKKQLRVLVVRVGAMGDIVHALPAVWALREQMPGWRIGWVVESRWEPLLRGAGQVLPVDQVHEIRVREWKKRPFSLDTMLDIVRLGLALRRERYDVCVDLQGTVRSAAIGRMAGAGCFVGAEEPREVPARMLYGERRPLRSGHVVEQACDLLGDAVGLTLRPGQVTFPEDPEVCRAVEARIAALGGGPFALLVPTAGWGAKEWPAERYRQLAGLLEADGLTVLVNAASAGDPVAGRVTESGAKVFSCSLPELIALVRRVALVIGGDTGPVHLAAAQGTPVLALFGPTDPARTGPQAFPGSVVRVLRDASSRTNHRRYRETEAGLAKITVEEVATAARQMLREVGRRVG